MKPSCSLTVMALPVFLTTFAQSATLSSPDATSFSGAPIIGSCNFNRAYPQLTVTGTADVGVLSVERLQTDPTANARRTI